MTGPDKGRFAGRPKVEITQVHGDLSQQVIQITVDKLTLILHRHASRLASQRDWLAPAGVVITIVATLVTTTFKDWLLSAATWNALFVLVGVIAGVRLVRSLWSLRTAPTVETLVERIKRQEE